MENILSNLQESDFISLNECSKITGIRLSTIVRYRKSGLFVSAHIIADKRCYLRDEVLEWKRPKKGKPGPKPKAKQGE